jgi:hypothetical protein
MWKCIYDQRPGSSSILIASRPPIGRFSRKGPGPDQCFDPVCAPAFQGRRAGFYGFAAGHHVVHEQDPRRSHPEARSCEANSGCHGPSNPDATSLGRTRQSRLPAQNPSSERQSQPRRDAAGEPAGRTEATAQVGPGMGWSGDDEVAAPVEPVGPGESRKLVSQRIEQLPPGADLGPQQDSPRHRVVRNRRPDSIGGRRPDDAACAPAAGGSEQIRRRWPRQAAAGADRRDEQVETCPAVGTGAVPLDRSQEAVADEAPGRQHEVQKRVEQSTVQSPGHEQSRPEAVCGAEREVGTGHYRRLV